jgi:L-threonylcarbamoyladenylate synthase
VHSRRVVTRTRLLPVDARAPDLATLQEAAVTLARRGLVAFPTETFYGLGAAALDGEAVRRIFAAKRRPESKPVLVLIDSLAMLETLVEEIPNRASALIDRHWPGPLTLVFRARASVPPEITAGTGTVGVRMPAHAVALGLARALGGPVTAPSANMSGAQPLTTAGEVLRVFDGMIELVLDGGATAGGPASTVVDVTVDPPRILRAGAVRL